MTRSARPGSLLFVLLAANVCSVALSQQLPEWKEAVLPEPGLSLKRPERISPAFGGGVWVTFSDATLWTASDQGRSWIPTTFPYGTEVEALCSLGEDRAWAAGAVPGGDAWLASTVDGGKTWGRVQATPDTAVGGFEDVQFFDKTFGIAVGGAKVLEGGSSLIAVTHDGGITWEHRLLSDDEVSNFLRSVRFDSEGTAWVAGGELIYVSRDRGVSWQVAHREPAASELGLIITHGSGVFATGGWGLVIHSGDSGKTWERLGLPGAAADRFLWSIDFADDLHGWVGGDEGFLLSTSDGGHTWRQEETPAKGLIRDIRVIGDRVYAAVDGLALMSRKVRD
jgi:photosystem II stability/assembly factor-like uncharacterized protein